MKTNEKQKLLWDDAYERIRAVGGETWMGVVALQKKQRVENAPLFCTQRPGGRHVPEKVWQFLLATASWTVRTGRPGPLGGRWSG